MAREYTPDEVASHVCAHQQLYRPQKTAICLAFWREQLRIKTRAWRLVSLPLRDLRWTDHARTTEVDEYVQQRRQGSPFPAIVVRPPYGEDPRWRVWDGNHRVSAAAIVGDAAIQAFVPVEDVPHVSLHGAGADVSLWLHPQKKPVRIDFARFADYPNFFDSFMQYEGVIMPTDAKVEWKPIKPYLVGFNDEQDEDPDFIADVSQMIAAGDDVPPILTLLGKLFDGRHRAWAARDAGLKKVPVVDLAPYWKEDK